MSDDSNSVGGDRPSNGLRRRQLLGQAAGAILGVALSSRPVGQVLGGAAPGDRATGTRETSFWRRVGDPYCRDGRRYEYWCYYNCYGSTCEVAYCETRDAGTC